MFRHDGNNINRATKRIPPHPRYERDHTLTREALCNEMRNTYNSEDGGEPRLRIELSSIKGQPGRGILQSREKYTPACHRYVSHANTSSTRCKSIRHRHATLCEFRHAQQQQCSSCICRTPLDRPRASVMQVYRPTTARRASIPFRTLWKAK